MTYPELKAAHCPRCLSETAPGDCFCQECGRDLKDIHGEIEKVSKNYSSDGVRTNQAIATSAGQAPKLFGRLHPGAERSVVALPLIAACCLGALALVPCTCFLIERSYSSISRQYVLERAHDSLSKRDYDEAIRTFEQAAIAEKLDDKNRQLLNDAYRGRAERSEALNLPGLAVNDLVRISADYRDFSAITKQLQEDRKLAASNTPSHADSITSRVSAARTKIVDQLLVRGRRQLAQALPQPVKATPQPPMATAAALASATGVAGKSEVAQTPLSVSERAPQGRELLSSPAGAGAKVEKALRSKSVESDVAAYNERLANYFSRDHDEAEARGARKHGEPPSFGEWLHQGKPDF